MTGPTTILHPLNESLSVPRTVDHHYDGTHGASQTTTALTVPSSSSATSSTHPVPAQPSSRTWPRGEPQLPNSQSIGTANTTTASSSRNNRLSLATLARDKTSSALANLASRPNPTIPSLHTSSSSSNLTEKRTLVNPQAASSGISATLEGQRGLQSQAQSRADPSREWENTHRIGGGSAPNETDHHPLYHAVQPSSRAAAFTPYYSPQGSFNKMHQTSSRLLRMTDEERPFTRVSIFFSFGGDRLALLFV